VKWSTPEDGYNSFIAFSLLRPLKIIVFKIIIRAFKNFQSEHWFMLSVIPFLLCFTLC